MDSRPRRPPPTTYDMPRDSQEYDREEGSSRGHSIGSGGSEGGVGGLLPAPIISGVEGQQITEKVSTTRAGRVAAMLTAFPELIRRARNAGERACHGSRDGARASLNAGSYRCRLTLCAHPCRSRKLKCDRRCVASGDVRGESVWALTVPRPACSQVA